MSKYNVHATNKEHDVEAHTYVIDSNGLRFIGADGVTVAVFTKFDWMKLIPADPVTE